MKKIWGAVFVVLMLVLSLVFLNWSGLLRFNSGEAGFWSSFPHLQSLKLNREGNRHLTAQNYQAAFDTYVKTLEFEPFSAETHLNLGLSFEGQQQAAKAMPSYQNALKYAQSDELKFMAYFNQAQLLGKEKKVDEALELYQQALNIDPTSKEAKTNIELLIQSQQQGGKDGDDKKDQQDPSEGKDQKDDQKDDQKKDQKKDPKEDQEQKDPKDQKDQGQEDKKEEKKENDKPKYAPNKKHQPRPFKGEELSEGDVKKILGEIKQQEQKIRSEYNRKEMKEQPRDKDW